MRLNDLFEMSLIDLRGVELAIEQLFKDLRLDVIWTVHFKERILNREQQVTPEELFFAFKKLKNKYGKRLQQAKDNEERFVGILKDMAADLNIPFVVDFSRENTQNHKYHLKGITIMRKRPERFHANIAGGEELKVENYLKI